MEKKVGLKKKGTNTDIATFLLNNYEINNIPLLAQIRTIPTEEGTTVVPNELLEWQNPDVMDPNHFWRLAVKKYPSFSIAGNENCETIEEINKSTLRIPEAFTTTKDLINDWHFSGRDVNLLEIGPGFGGFREFLGYKTPNVIWHGIDVNPLFEHPNLYETDGHSIPECIPTLDVIYSLNVFQHLSERQRRLYYEAASDRLKPGGVFVFGMFVISEDNENETNEEGKPLFGVMDENGAYYTHFFSQYTKINTVEETLIELAINGFGGFSVEMMRNYGVFRAIKQ